jgi:hypothetical protein
MQTMLSGDRRMESCFEFQCKLACLPSMESSFHFWYCRNKGGLGSILQYFPMTLAGEALQSDAAAQKRHSSYKHRCPYMVCGYSSRQVYSSLATHAGSRGLGVQSSQYLAWIFRLHLYHLNHIELIIGIVRGHHLLSDYRLVLAPVLELCRYPATWF